MTIARFRKLACSQDGLMEELFYAVLAACAAAGLGRLTVVAGDGVKIGANASKEANRTEAGLAKLAAGIVADAAAAEADEAEGAAHRAGADLLGGEVLRAAGLIRGRGRAGCAPAWTNRKRAGGGGGGRAGGRAGLPGRAGGWHRHRTAPGAGGGGGAADPGGKAVAAQQALIDDWQARRAAARGPGWAAARWTRMMPPPSGRARPAE